MYSILIADDEKTIRESLPVAINFEQQGFRVCATAKNGQDALEKTAEFHPDVVLLDVCMPVLDGLGFLKELHGRKDIPAPRVVMLSGYSDFEYARTALRFGVKAYLTKPLDEEEMAQVLLELKKELEQQDQDQNQERLREKTGALQKLYHDGDGDREPYRDLFLMHCVVLAESDSPEAYSVIRSCMEACVPQEQASLFRRRGSIFCYLISREVLADYQYNVMLFARHILYQIKKSGMECALLFDENLFTQKKNSFRSDYDLHLYRMLSAVFWNEERILRCQGAEIESESEQQPEQEDAWLGCIKRAIREKQEDLLWETFDQMTELIEKRHLSITYIQKISYRVYYALTDLLTEAGEEAADRLLTPLDWRDAPCFIGFAKWKEALREQMRTIFYFVKQSGGGRQDSSSARMIAYIRQHFREQISLKRVADQFYVSTAVLGKCVQKETGVGFKQYVNDLRMEEAKRLLVQTDRLVYEIAEEVGFRESKYFVSKFSAEVGKTPLEYRRIMQEQYLHKKQ